ncbi:MAG: hypothetical protein JXR91_00210 [Deltaproteobacteria bacterium]|nr:hypothetical protein [Deltaproteobacteria bacterium]
MKKFFWILFFTSSIMAVIVNASAEELEISKGGNMDLGYFCLEDLEFNISHPGPVAFKSQGEQRGNGLCKTPLFDYSNILDAEPTLAVLSKDRQHGFYGFKINIMDDQLMDAAIDQFEKSGWHLSEGSLDALKKYKNLKMVQLEKNNSTADIIVVDDLPGRPMVFVRLN